MIANRTVCFCNIREVSTGRVVRTCHIVREDGETFAFFGKPAAIAATVPCNAMQCHAMPCNAVQCHANKQEIQDMFEEIMHEKIFVDVKAVTSVVSGLSPSKC